MNFCFQQRRDEKRIEKKNLEDTDSLEKGRKKVLHIFLSLKFPESESQFWTVRGNPSARESHHLDPFGASLEWVLLLQKKLCFLFLQKKHCFQYCKGTLSSTYMFEIVQILVLTRRRMRKVKESIQRQKYPPALSKYQNTPCERCQCMWSGQWIFQWNSSKVKHTDHFLETQEICWWDRVTEEGPANCVLLEGGTNEGIEEIRSRKTGWSFFLLIIRRGCFLQKALPDP